MTNSNDRNKDVALLRCLGFSSLVSCVTFMVLLLTPARPFALTIIMMLLGMRLILLTQSAITSSLLIMPVVGIFKWQQMPLYFVVPFLAAILWQTTLLLRKCCLQLSGEATTSSTVIRAFHRSMGVLALVLMVLAVALLYTGSKNWPSETSSTLAAASYLVFAHASWVAHVSTESTASESSIDSVAFNFKDVGSRSVISGDQSLAGYSSKAISIDRSPISVPPWITLFYPILYSVLLVVAPESSTEVYSRLLVVFLTLGWQPPFFYPILLYPVRFDVLPNASVLVETIGRTYVYHEAISVCLVLEPAGAPPKTTETCHVYCTDLGAPRVVVEVLGGTSLHLTPKYPEEFVNALTRAINRSNSELDKNASLIEEEVVSCGIELERSRVC